MRFVQTVEKPLPNEATNNELVEAEKKKPKKKQKDKKPKVKRVLPQHFIDDDDFVPQTKKRSKLDSDDEEQEDIPKFKEVR